MSKSGPLGRHRRLHATRESQRMISPGLGASSAQASGVTSAGRRVSRIDVHFGPLHRVDDHGGCFVSSMGALGGGREPIILLGRHQHELAPAMPGDLHRVAPSLMLEFRELTQEFREGGSAHGEHLLRKCASKISRRAKKVTGSCRSHSGVMATVLTRNERAATGAGQTASPARSGTARSSPFQ